MTADQPFLTTTAKNSPDNLLPDATTEHPFKRFVLANIQGAIAASVTGTFLLFGASTWNVWQLYQGFQENIELKFELQDLSDDIVYYDEVLTMSARMSASTADPKWEERYWENEPQLTAALDEVSKLVPEVVKTQTQQTDEANNRLIEMEEQAFELVEAGKAKAAFDLLLSPEYTKQKEIYAAGITQTIEVIAQEIEELRQTYLSQLKNSLLFAGLSLPLLGFSTFVVFWLIRTYLSDRRRAEIALQFSQESLVEANKALEENLEMIEQKTLQIAHKEKQTALESELLQADIGHLLDVLSDLEAGDLTVEAEVTDRVTGLVSDTLNRLIENLSATLSQVAETAKITADSSNDVKNYAEEVASEVSQQEQGVNEMLGLTETVWQSAQEAIAKIEATQDILTQVRQSVDQGQNAINEMNEGIDQLQTGSDRMVQRIKTLGEFVSLADQFVQEQNQTAAMTQVLALNASLVAAKAAEQQDPAQFQLVAREFESIANQVQQLAQQTNTGLESLQKRTTKIHGVVSDVDREVQGLNKLVSNFSQGVTESTQVFSDVQSKTLEVSTSGEAVEQGSQKIIKAAENTRDALRSIATQARLTTQRMQSTLNSSFQMKEISSQLIESIQVFSLPGNSSVIESSQAEPEFDDEDITHLSAELPPQSAKVVGDDVIPIVDAAVV